MRPRWLFQFSRRTPRQIRDDFEEELALHRDLRVAELTARGLTRTEADRVTEREFGDVDDARRYVRAVDGAAELNARGRDMIRETWYDVRTVVRRLRRSSLFTMTALFTLTLGIGACVLMFNIVSAVLFAPLPFKNADQVVMIWGDLPQVQLGFTEMPIEGRYFSDIRDHASAFQSLAAFRAAPFNVEAGTSPERVDGLEATGDFFDAIGVSPEVGRFFSRENERAGNDRVVVISDELWRRSFAGARSVIGQVVTINTLPYTILGVAPPGFVFPRGAEMPGDFQLPERTLLWVPLEPPKGGPSDLAVIGRMKPGVAVTAARADLDRVRAIEERLLPQEKGWFGTTAVPLRTQLVGHSRRMLLSLLGAVVLLLVLACANTAQLQVARLHARRRELAIRAALGASAGRIASELLIEVALLITVGWLLGTSLAVFGVKLISVYAGARVPRLDAASFDIRPALIALAAAAITGVLASLVPGTFAARVPLAEVLRRGARGAGGTSAASSHGARRWLIVAELTLCVVLVACAGLLVRSLSRELGSATGFSAPNGLTFEVTLPAAKYPERQGSTFMEHPAAAAFFTQALARLREIPGVEAAAIGKPLPLSGAQEATVFRRENAPPLAAGEPNPIAEYTVASPGMFRALGTPLIAGRDFTGADRLETEPVVIVNAAMASWLWPHDVAVGKRLKLGGPRSTAPWMTVIGVATDMKRFALTDTAKPEMIVPYTQNPYPTFLTMQFAVRSRLGAEQLVPEIRTAIAGVDRSVPISHVRTIADLIGETSASARFATTFMSAFGAAALALAMIGVYGLVAFTVQQRRQEFGVRRALGAAPREVLGLVLREGLGLATIGVVSGLAIAVGAGYLLRHLLYEVSTYDPFTLGATALVLASATLLACLGPAWRASRVEAKVALEEV